MSTFRFRALGLTLVAGVSLSACSTYGNGYGPYNGYSGVSVGYGTAYSRGYGSYGGYGGYSPYSGGYRPYNSGYYGNGYYGSGLGVLGGFGRVRHHGYSPHRRSHSISTGGHRGSGGHRRGH